MFFGYSFDDVRRRCIVFFEFHRVACATLGHGADVGRITEHLTQRNLGTNHFAGNRVFHTQDHAATTVKVAHHVTHIVFRRNNLYRHDRLKQLTTALLGQLLGRHGSSHLKRHLVRVDVMVGTIKHGSLQADQRIAGNNAVLHLLFDTLLDSRDVFLRNNTTHHFVYELQTFLTFVSRSKTDPAVTKLATTAGLTNELAFDFTILRDALTIGNLRLADVGFDVELTAHPVNQDVQVELAHARDDRLTSLFISFDAERRVFLSKFAQCNTHFFLVILGLWLNGNRNNRLREVHTNQDDWLVSVAQGFTSGDVLHADQGRDVTSAHFLDLFTGVCVHLHHTTHALFLAFDRVDHAVAGCQHARVNADESQSTHEWVGSDLERQRRERFAVVCMTLHQNFLVIRIGTLDSRNIDWSRQVVDHGVENQGNTLVLEGRTANSKNDLTSDSTLTQSGLDFLVGELFTFKVLVHQLFAGFSRSLNHVATPFISQFLQFSRDRLANRNHAFVSIVPVNSFHSHQVDLTLEVVFSTDGQLNRHRGVTQALLDLSDYAQKVGTSTVHLVHVDDTWNTVLVGLTPYGFGLRLYAGSTTEHNDRAVEYTQGTLNFNGEVYVTRGVNDVEAVLVFVLLLGTLPKGSDSSRSNGNTTLLLLNHPVRGRGAIMHLAHFVAFAGVKKDALGGGGFTSIHVSDDTDVTVTANRSSTSHKALANLVTLKLEAVVRESLVGLGHTVHVFTLLDRSTFTFGGVHQFASQTQSHRLLTALAREVYQPTHCQSITTGRTNFDRNLVSSTAYTARLYFDQRSDGVESFLEDFQGVAVLAFFNLFQRAINDTLGNGFLAALHYVVHELGQDLAAVFWIVKHFALGCYASSWHG
ncbi:hypothetical protein ALQ36_05199 [Pseudomonas syringae pv. primulae]|uniref:Uncharacterized protein n=1 Tax=Pseudomonas syringae pv. primulae TaxID=251707 RepID=A0A3M3Y8D8_9PSED|nr:hypothetical protein ALQ36_05199 [Pseudomonas syringae pv. primulae]